MTWLSEVADDEILPLALQHNFWTWSAQGQVARIPVVRAEGSHFWDVHGKRYLDFNSMVMCSNIGHGEPAGHRGHGRAGARADLRRPRDGDPTAGPPGRAAGGDHPRRPESVSLHPGRRRCQRERHQAGPRLHRPAQDPGALPLLPRRHGRRHGRHRRPAPRRPGSPPHAGRGPLPRPVPLPFGLPSASEPTSTKRSSPRTTSTTSRRSSRSKARRRSPPSCSRPSPAPTASSSLRMATCKGCARSVRPLRHPADLRRSDVGFGRTGKLVRRRPLGRRPGHDDHGQGADLRLCPARRRRHDARQSPRPSPTESTRAG